MKICPKCNTNKVKNSYLHCYNCNMKDDLSSEVDNEKEIKREPIPKCVRNALWINYRSAKLDVYSRRGKLSWQPKRINQNESAKTNRVFLTIANFSLSPPCFI